MEPDATFTLLTTIVPTTQGSVKMNRVPRPLSFDETSAAEAAFQGRSLSPAWSASALQIYFGLQAALTARRGQH